jgi:hypothetical protein
MNKKFIIFSQSRSGSTLLKELLHSHPSVNCEGEILALSEGYIKNVLLLKILRRMPIPYFYIRYFIIESKSIWFYIIYLSFTLHQADYQIIELFRLEGYISETEKYS